jgi:hypothetical protein
MAETSGHIDPGALERSLQGLRKTARADALEEALAEVLDAACLLFSISGTGLMVIERAPGAVLRGGDGRDRARPR